MSCRVRVCALLGGGQSLEHDQDPQFIEGATLVYMTAMKITTVVALWVALRAEGESMGGCQRHGLYR